jgi:arginine decarboxylase
MKIQIAKGIGTGPTELSAFDAALVDSGVANFNLLYLSSVLPPGSNIEICKDKASPKGSWGDRLYLVIAQKRTIQRNQEVWAGIGWVQDKETKKGLLVEHEGHNEAEVRADIENSLQGLMVNRNANFGPTHMVVTGVRCEDRPVCALVVAVFESHNWIGNADESTPNRLQRLANRIARG